MPSEFEIAFDRARRAMREGFADVALGPATEAVKSAPDRWDARLLLARVWLDIGGPARAIADARAALELGESGGMPPEDRRLAHDVIARAALREGDLDAAEPSLRVACEDPQAVATRVRLVALLVDRDRGSEARDALGPLAREGTHDADASGPGREVAGAAGALALALAGHDGAGAATTLPGVQLALGDLELAAGLADEARRRFQREFQRDPNSERAADGLRRVSARNAPGRKGARSGPDGAGSAPLVLFRGALVALNLAAAVWVMVRRDFVAGVTGLEPRLVLAAAAALMLVTLVVAFGMVRRPPRQSSGTSSATAPGTAAPE